MRKPSWILVIMMAAAMVASYGVAFAGTNTTLPFEDTFESYTNGTPLIGGTNGWYGSSADIVVQTNVHYPEDGSSTNAAMIPVDCTL
ncbi:MAG: hypothetical protein KKF10_06260, partial [Verrucomicrobia bacterium]|nr:hypothetical protein [Verrucomicrobiota bacterium]